MEGYVQDAVSTALKNWPALKEAFCQPVRQTGSSSSVVVNTELPAIIVEINGIEGEGNTYLGGGIRQYFELTLHYIADVINYTFSPDKGTQSKRLDLSDEVIRCMELSEDLLTIKQQHDFNMQFDRMETETTYGSKTSTGQTYVVNVHRIVYKCDVEFDPHDEAYNRYVTLKKVIIEEQSTGIKTIIPNENT